MKRPPSPTALRRPDVSEERAAGFVMRIAKALNQYGVPAHRLEALLALLASKLGIQASFYSSPTAMFISVGPPEALRTTMIRVEPGDIDLGKLADADALTSEVIEGRISVAQAELRLQEILEAPSQHSTPLTVFCYLLASGGAAVLLGGNAHEALVGALIGLFLGIFSLLAAKTRIARLTNALGGVGAALIAAAFSRWVGPLSEQAAIIAGLIVLLPGLTLTIAVNELATRHLASGTTRLTFAMLALFEIGFGVLIGTQLVAGIFPPMPETGIPNLELASWTVYPALVLGTGAFSVLFLAHRRDAVWIIVACALAFLSARAASIRFDPVIGAFLGAIVVAVASNAFARLRDKPAVITLVPGLLMLVPGSVGYRSMDAFIDQDPTTGVAIAFTVVLVTVSIVMGMLVANILVPPRRVL